MNYSETISSNLGPKLISHEICTLHNGKETKAVSLGYPSADLQNMGPDHSDPRGGGLSSP